jgi:hypothetical protein
MDLEPFSLVAVGFNNKKKHFHCALDDNLVLVLKPWGLGLKNNCKHECSNVVI